MRILIDTNICLDILQKRPEFYDSSKNALLYASQKNYKLYLTSATVMDIMYITRKSFDNSAEQKTVVKDFVSAFRFLKISKKNVNFGFLGVIKDFEDAVQASCAKKHFLNLIITRNIKDFVNSPVKAITPEEFLRNY
ncbi:MAG: PIN domain-containing protein [Treponema sp.]|nr:PIN domain-containing protein [Treponema sp.]